MISKRFLSKKGLDNEEVKVEESLLKAGFVALQEEIQEAAQAPTVEQSQTEIVDHPVKENVPTLEQELEIPFKAYSVLGIRAGQTPQGTDFLKVAVKSESGQNLVIARGAVIEELDEVEDGGSYLFHIENVNGYDTLIAFGGLAV